MRTERTIAGQGRHRISRSLWQGDLLQTEEFRVLFAELEELETRQLRSGALTSDSARRDQIEHRLLTLVSTVSPTPERRRFRRVACDLWVELHVGSGSASGAIVDIGVGGALVHTVLRLRPHEEVKLVVARQPGLLEHGIEVHCLAAWLEEDARAPQFGVGVSFAATHAEETARLRRMCGLVIADREPTCCVSSTSIRRSRVSRRG